MGGIIAGFFADAKRMQNKSWNFDNSYARLPDFFYARQNPVPVRASDLVIFNDSLADFLGVPAQPEVFSGNLVPAGAEPLAQAYSGHQFGYFTMLGDGRAILLGEQITAAGERFDIQLKGSGRTPYSRDGDGRAALGPMLREYIISEAMYALGIPTTRSLAVVATGETVIREAGHREEGYRGIKLLPGAVLTRVAGSHIRVGTFEYARRFGSTADIRCLADYAIGRHFPGLLGSDNRYLLMLREVVKLQAFLISGWQLAGFIHGVMNTDNMAISGETIDYGPCAFMDVYHPETVFSSIDRHGRYCYQNQPEMAVWNLARFTEALLPLLDEDEKEAWRLGQAETAKFRGLHTQHWLAGMRAKLGFFRDEAADEPLIHDLLRLMQAHRADYTNTFRFLTLRNQENPEPRTCQNTQMGISELIKSSAFHDWERRWLGRLEKEAKTEKEAKALMRRNNPAIIARNHRVEEALAAAENGDLGKMEKLLEALMNPYAYLPGQDAFANVPPDGSCGYRTFCGT